MSLDPVDDGVQTWASPGVIADPWRPELGAFATLTVVSSVTARVADPLPGAEPADVLLSGLLGRGFALLPALSVEEFLALPVLTDWAVHHIDDVLHVVEPDGSAFYVGDLGPAVPGTWEATLRGRGRLIVLACSGIDLRRPNRTELIVRSVRRGDVVAAQIGLTG